MAKITRYRIFYEENGKKGGTYFVGGKKTMQKKLKILRKDSNVKWTIRPVRRNTWVKKKK